MLRVFNSDITEADNFVVTLELVPGRESTGRSVDTLTEIAKDAFSDGRVSAVSITDNPGGNPSLSPDALGHEIFRYGMDVIVHFTCRDSNRAGMESRALQLARLGMKNILALTGDYSGRGYGGQGAPVFDFDSVILTRMLKDLNIRLLESGDPDGFFTGCAVSPFKSTCAESEGQYRKLALKVRAGSDFIITQLGYDATLFKELLQQNRNMGIDLPLLASLYMLSPRAAKAMNMGKVPGVVVTDDLCNRIEKEWQNKKEGLQNAIERTARLGVVLKGMGYRGIHIGGIHKDFETVGKILDRMDEIENQWQSFLNEFTPSKEQNHAQGEFTPSREQNHSQGELTPTRESGFYQVNLIPDRKCRNLPHEITLKTLLFDHIPYRFLNMAHGLFFNKSAYSAPMYKKIAEKIETKGFSWIIKRFLEDPFKKTLLSCRSCGDCGIQHLAFQCPESGCPKHTRNGACGGSRDGFCEVNKDRLCVWVRSWIRLSRAGSQEKFTSEFVPPRKWELNETSSWINFHLGRDHQG
ncbi:Methylenetetrahydrofolate reductase [Desulfamplus magnetovallimortis]|uniref:Methylenetetrahydrofolate reductase n=1 Tax=Desulfamplus magnetovallimortis TaxID=1246637 RepID=A0A1W1HHI3_9BACT|nr:methylenetetrahydrofolate reductase C-terminal domain-containing protein [Desulfamplus magnetovallimortis]SLM31944.1 Methylenetetrahydrofolate reductase [Desulfamplus magnetovallimortis]